MILCCLVLGSILLAGCTAEKDVPEQSKEPVTLYVQIPAFTMQRQIDRFKQDYTFPYEVKNPHVTIEVFGANYTGTEQPDIYMIGADEFKEKLAQAELAPIEPIMKSDNFDYASLSIKTSIADQIIRSYASDYTLYGVATNVMAEGLFYNKDLFDEYGVPYPTNHMTWQEVLELASRFPATTETGEHLYGLTFETYRQAAFTFIAAIMNSEEMSPLDYLHGKVLIDNTPEWRSIWELAVPVLQAGHVPKEIDEYNLNNMKFTLKQGSLFHQGRAAMHLSSENFAKFLTSNMKNNEIPLFDWGIVTAPVSAKKPVGLYQLGNVLAISESSEHKEEAWNFIRYLLEPSIIEAASHPDIESLYTLNPSAGFSGRYDIPLEVGINLKISA